METIGSQGLPHVPVWHENPRRWFNPEPAVSMRFRQMATYTIDSVHSYIGFSVRHMMVTQQRGQFHSVSGTANIDRANLAASSVEAVIGIDSIDTNNEQRDAHLKSADFFDAANHPNMTFKSTGVTVTSDGRLHIAGDLTIRGTTKAVVLDADPITPDHADPWGNVKAGTSASTKVSRKEFGLHWNAALEAGGVVVGDEVKINLDLEFQLQA